MNVLPQQLKGKTVYDCYIKFGKTVVIEFTDGSKIEIRSSTFNGKKSDGGKEIFIDIEL